MRIIFWTFSHLPDLGGFQWSTFRLARALKELGHEPLFLTGTTQASEFDSVVDAIRISAANVPDWTMKSGRWLLENHHRFDVVHAIDLFYKAIGEQVGFLLDADLPAVIKIPTQGYVPRLITDCELKHKFRLIDAIIALNNGIKTELLEIGVKPERIYAIPNGIDSREFIPASDKTAAKKLLAFPRHKITVLYAGRFVQRKRIDVLLEAAKSLPKTVQLVLVGSGFEMRDSVERELIQLASRIPNARIVKAIPNILAYYQASDINVLLSEREGQSNSILEGMACGLPTIATDIPGISETVHAEVEGILVKVGDIEGTEKALLRLILSQDLRIKMGDAGRNRILREFDIRIIAQRYENLYREIITKNKEGGRVR